MKMRIVIVGGVAGGASAAARARRVDSEAEIVILEKGPVISYANCGLPYHLGGEIAKREKLLVASPELFWKRFRIGVKTRHEVLEVDRVNKKVLGIDHATGAGFEFGYDRLILSMGSEPIAPDSFQPMPSNAFHLWTLSDMDRIIAYMDAIQSKSAVILGGGFVGLEVVEQLQRRGIQVWLIERNPQVLKPLDWEIARIIQQHMEAKGVRVLLEQKVRKIVPESERAKAIELEDGSCLAADLFIVATGIRPRTKLAQDAGLAIGSTQGVLVNDWLQTSDPSIYAVGDIAEVVHGVTGKRMRIPLAGPANRAGRIAGEHAASGNAPRMGKVWGTAIVRVFDLTAGCTGLNESSLKASGIPFRSVIIQAANHASYYPGAESMHLKLMYRPDDGKILGGQAVGGEGVDKRIDIISTMLHMGGTVHQLAELDLAYAPPFGSAKDPIHMAAFAACNDLNQLPKLIPPNAALDRFQVVDVRTCRERDNLPLRNAIPIEIDDLAQNWTSLDPQKPTVVVCHSGKRAHVGACLLNGKGFESVSNLSGGMSIRSLFEESQ
jgi:NADPH-dependent 2,4-dienoyl-CoA reductase/sulfur reductase-like enzyme/rhodanese-related sulfurtransferase